MRSWVLTATVEVCCGKRKVRNLCLGLTMNTEASACHTCFALAWKKHDGRRSIIY
jgi:hypothetical protein